MPPSVLCRGRCWLIGSLQRCFCLRYVRLAGRYGSGFREGVIYFHGDFGAVLHRHDGSCYLFVGIAGFLQHVGILRDDFLDVIRIITGIAGRRNFSIITMAKNGLSSSIGSLRRVLEVFERHNLNVEYTPSGIDSVSLVVQSGKAASCLYSILGELQKEFRPDKLQVAENISIVAAVGRKMAFRPGISGKIFAALGENGISIRMISQGPEELNIIVGVDNADFEKTVRVLYESFVR